MAKLPIIPFFEHFAFNLDKASSPWLGNNSRATMRLPPLGTLVSVDRCYVLYASHVFFR